MTIKLTNFSITAEPEDDIALEEFLNNQFFNIWGEHRYIKEIIYNDEEQEFEIIYSDYDGKYYCDYMGRADFYKLVGENEDTYEPGFMELLNEGV